MRRFPGYVAVVVAVVGLAAIMVVQGIPNRHGVEQNLTARSTTALRAAGLSDVDVAFVGRDGTVTAGSSAEAERALTVVRGVTGVRVARAVVVQRAAPPQETAPPQQNPPTTPPSVSASVDRGRVVLTGNVPTEASRTALGDAAAASFDSVDNQITVDPAVTDAGLSGLAGVLNALGPEAEQATVELRGGRLTLSGTVPSEATRAAAVAAATAVVGSAAVTDRLVVVTIQQRLGTLPPVTFQDNSAVLTPQGRAVLVRVAAVLTAHPTVRVRIEGHTDSTGSAAANLALSQARAATVLAVLRSLGIAAERMTSTGFGETRPKVPNDTPANRAVNRRVEFVVQQ